MCRSLKTNALILLCTGLTLFSQAQQTEMGNRSRPRKQYTTEQATSERAQLHTIAFNGLAFLTGNFGADCFFPPGKVADFFGFQYMRDNDSNQLGHNTDFLTRIANNVLQILNDGQREELMALGKEQESLYDDFAWKRIVLIRAFRESLEGKGTLDRDSVVLYCRKLYAIDAQLSYRRAEVLGKIVRSLRPEQTAAFDRLRFGNSMTWPAVREQLDKRSLSHRAHVAVMTYASELFSWYKGSLTADIYFCPERHGTYFGGFFLKDYPAMGNPGYSIPTALTGESGRSFLEQLTPDQRNRIEILPSMQKKYLEEAVRLRERICMGLRGFLSGNIPDKTETLKQIEYYGEQDGILSYMYATAFIAVDRTLSAAQRETLKQLRNLNVTPPGIYIYSDPEPMPRTIDFQFLFRDRPEKKGF